jgi:hypothetical protein
MASLCWKGLRKSLPLTQAETSSKCLQETKESWTSKLIYTKLISCISCFQTKIFKLFSPTIRALCPAQSTILQGKWQLKSMVTSYEG